MESAVAGITKSAMFAERLAETRAQVTSVERSLTSLVEVFENLLDDDSIVIPANHVELYESQLFWLVENGYTERSRAAARHLLAQLYKNTEQLKPSRVRRKLTQVSSAEPWFDAMFSLRWAKSNIDKGYIFDAIIDIKDAEFHIRDSTNLTRHQKKRLTSVINNMLSKARDRSEAYGIARYWHPRH